MPIISTSYKILTQPDLLEALNDIKDHYKDDYMSNISINVVGERLNTVQSERTLIPIGSSYTPPFPNPNREYMSVSFMRIVAPQITIFNFARVPAGTFGENWFYSTSQYTLKP